LPPLFREVSGLAISEDGRLWIHNDEQGVVGAIDTRTGQVVGVYRLGPAIPRADFEGIAAVGAELFLVTSHGVLFAMKLPPAGSKDGVLGYQMFETGFGKSCEVEGLGYEPRDQSLLVACKTPRRKALENRLAIFRWSVSTRMVASPDRIVVSWSDLARGRSGKAFHASGIDRDPVSGSYLVISSADHAFAVLDRMGRVESSGPLGRHHPQAEGVAIAKDGTLFVSDEGGKGLGTIAVYACH
jgi:uncharacterized protein YjiK